ncbi:MAG: hypothetical protein WD066_13300 [Planctomycetaceae bacterium]
MKSRLLGFGLVLLSAVGLLCFAVFAQNREGDPAAEAAANQPAAGAAEASFTGKWRLVVTQGGTDVPLMIIEVARQEEAHSARVIASHRQFPDAKVERTAVEDGWLHLVFSANGEKYELQGRRAGDAIRGNVLFEEGGCYPVRLTATEEGDLADAQAGSHPDLDVLRAAARAEDSVEALAKFARDNPESPLSLTAWQQAIIFATGNEDAEKQVRELIDEYIQAAAAWGPRMVWNARVNVAVHLVERDKFPQFAEQSLDAAEAGFDETSKKALARTVVVLRTALEDQKRRVAILAAREAIVRGNDEDARKEAVALLERLRPEHPLDPVILFTLAQHAENEKRVDEAIDLYGRLAILPQLEGMLFSMLESEDDAQTPYPMESARDLWEAKHKNVDGFEKHLHEIYRAAIHSFAGEPSPAQPAGNHVVLVELFTGSECPPCVAADVATGALETAFPKEQVVVLRYHQHIPGPDPLTSSDGWDRFQMYGLQGTPSVLVDGEPVQGVAGPLFMAPEGYRQLRKQIEPLVAEKSAVTIELSAKAEDGKLAISAKADGLGERRERARLVLALVEPDVSYRAGNGILHHEMVVRAMPTGPQGVETADGPLAYSQQLSLAEFKAGLEKYLADFEEEEGVQFPEKPLALEKLYFVAIVQDGETGRVLGTRAVPVTGKLEYPAGQAKDDESDDR